MTLLDGAPIGQVVFLLIALIAVLPRLLADEDGESHRDAPWPQWASRRRR
jgi:hypothetical protein